MRVQKTGWSRFGNDFNFLAYLLQQFGLSPIDSREKENNGNLTFAVPPFLDCDLAIYTGTAHPEFAEFRLDLKLASPFKDHRFRHPQTVWYNIASRLGTRAFFPKNADQILDFFAGLICSRLRMKRRPLLISKKCFLQKCAEGIQSRLNELGLEYATVVAADLDNANLSSPNVIPLSHYGLIGTNLFEGFDCAYCLNSYYVSEAVVNEVLQDVLASDSYIPIQIVTEGRPRRRTAIVKDPEHRFYDIRYLAPLALSQQELDVVLQAVGRVRPYTQSREIITFQCAGHPQLPFEAEFNSIAEAREFFGIDSSRHRKKLDRIKQIRLEKEAGSTQIEAASKIGISLRTVKRYWNSLR
jgi:hypothetical protein